MNLTLRRRIDQIRQRWWVVVVVAVIAVLAATLGSLLVPTKYVGDATLVVSSPNQSPEQDAKVVEGYTSVFNDPATIDRLRASKDLPSDVTFEAKTLAASPILAVQATASSQDIAEQSATLMARAFRDDVNSARAAANNDAMADLQRQLDEVVARSLPGEAPSETENRLRERINTLKFDTTDQLRDLQLQASVKPMTPNLRLNVALAAVGGVLLGVLAALGMAAASTRIRNSEELFEKTGVASLVEVTGRRSRRERAARRDDSIRTLANILGTDISAKSTTISVIDSRGVVASRDVAVDLAKIFAQQEYRTVLVCADAPSPHQEDLGPGDVLRDGGLVHLQLQDGGIDHLKILPRAGLFATRSSHMTRARIDAVLAELLAEADVVVLAAPSAGDTADAQLLCSAADLTILCVDARSSRADDVSSVVDVLEKAGAVVRGAVLVNGWQRRSTESPMTPRQHSRQATEVADNRGRPVDVGSPGLK
jgi:capsular polysaccharide biosynthesis protein